MIAAVAQGIAGGWLLDCSDVNLQEMLDDKVLPPVGLVNHHCYRVSLATKPLTCTLDALIISLTF